MNKLYFSLITGLFLTACGGGSSNDNDRIINARDSIQGDWISSCQAIVNGTSRIQTRSYFTTEDGNDAFLYGLSEFTTSNCSGEGTSIILGGPVSYEGEHTTSICIAEKIDQEVLLVTDGDTQLEGDAAQDFLISLNLSPTTYDIACTLDDQMFTGLNTESLNGGADSRRPVEMNVSVPFNVWVIASKKGGGNNNLSISDNMKRISRSLQSYQWY